MAKYARRDDVVVVFETPSNISDGYPISIDVSTTNVGFYTGARFGFAVKFTDGAWDDFVTIVNYIDQVVLKTKE